MSRLEGFCWNLFTLVGGLAGVGLFATAIVVGVGIIVCVLGKGCPS